MRTPLEQRGPSRGTESQPFYTSSKDRCACTCGKHGCAINDLFHIGARHGTSHCYNNGCRCEPCCEAKQQLANEQYTRRQSLTAIGSHRGYTWTGAEMEMALRDDLTVTEIALRLGRTYAAVRNMRRKILNDPRYAKAATGEPND